MVVRGGDVVAEGWWAPYGRDLLHQVNSVSKTVVGTAVGLAIDEGRLALDDLVVSFFPNELPPELGEGVQRMRVVDLLTMTTGHEEETTDRMVTDTEGNFVRGFLALPLEHEPGTHFKYNSGASYMLSAIVRAATGETFMDYLQPRLFKPLGIEGSTSLTCPRGIPLGFAGWSGTTEHLAKLALLHLQGGEWRGRRILSREWVDAATSSQTRSGLDLYEVQRDPQRFAYYPRERENNEYAQGYGYHIWRGRHGSYRASGAFGQFAVVLPELDAVVVTTANEPDTHRVMDKVWKHILPAFDRGDASADADATLAARLASLELPRPASHVRPEAMAGTALRFTMEPNFFGVTDAEFLFSEKTCTLRLVHGAGAVELVAGTGGWHDGVLAMPAPLSSNFLSWAPGMRAEPYAAACHWQDEHSLVLLVNYTDSPLTDTITCEFTEDGVRVSFLTSVTGIFPASERRPPLQGRAAIRS
nr:serine hydrolase domain-containing protein [Ornithinimicrobium cryptoxanthini]